MVSPGLLCRELLRRQDELQCLHRANTDKIKELWQREDKKSEALISLMFDICFRQENMAQGRSAALFLQWAPPMINETNSETF